MDATATALAALVIGLTSLVLYNRRGTNHSVVKEVEGEKVNRAAIHPEDLLKCPNNVTTAYESFVYVSLLFSPLFRFSFKNKFNLSTKIYNTNNKKIKIILILLKKIYI